MAKVLEVQLYGQHIGYLKQGDNGRLSFDYDLTYISRPHHPVLSLAMPLANVTYGHGVCHAVFGGMLPEGEVRSRLAKVLGVSEQNDFSLLAEIGGECAGAVTLASSTTRPKPDFEASGKAVSDEDLERLLKLVATRPLLTGDGIRLSLAGAQNKLALAGTPTYFRFPRELEPSTYILKPASPDFLGFVQNEFFCMRLAALVGIHVAPVTMGRAGTIDYLCVERFDRRQSGDTKNRRIHQEDFCQALGVVPENKYQAEGGPGLQASVDLIRRHSIRPAADLAAYLRLVYFNYLIGNADAHAKNFSLLLGSEGPVLAPGYDLLCTAIYPNLNTKMAMKIGSEYDPDRVAARHWADFAAGAELKPGYVLSGLGELATKMLEQGPNLAASLDDNAKVVADRIIAVVRARAAKLR